MPKVFQSGERKRKGRNNRGVGTVYWHDRLGRYCAQVTVGRKADGGRDRRTIYGRQGVRTEEERARVQTAAMELGLKARQGDLPEVSRTTLKQYIDTWVEEHAYQQLSPVTAYTYEKKLSKHIIPVLGKERVQALKRLAIQKAINKLHETGCPRPTLTLALIALRSALETAVQWGYREDNPADHVKVPRERAAASSPEPERILTADQAQRLLASSEGRPTHILWLLALACGLRAGEITGLRWRDIDWSGSALNVRQALKNLPKRRGGLQAGPPKSANSIRTVPVPAFALASLLDHRDRTRARLAGLGQVLRPTDAVAINSRGNRYNPSDLPTLLRAAVARAGVPYANPHALRHSCATFLAAQGVPLPAIQDILGHDSLEITMHYTHGTAEQFARAAQALDGLLAWRREPEAGGELPN